MPQPLENPVNNALALENIYLVGLMGAGKTSVGRYLAKNLGKTFYDCDHEVERRTGVKIPLIFEIEGEQGFRARATSATTAAGARRSSSAGNARVAH